MRPPTYVQGITPTLRATPGIRSNTPASSSPFAALSPRFAKAGCRDVHGGRALNPPADSSTAPMAGGSQPRVRSISMNCYVGEESRTWTSPSRYTLCTKAAQIKSPVYMFVVLDEREARINDGWFTSDPDGLYQLVDYPASYHGNAGGLSFADGDSEIHKWIDPRTRPVL